MKINCYIKSGIDRTNVDELKKLANYIQHIESIDINSCRQLDEILEEEPMISYEPQRIDNNSKFPIKDLAFIYNNQAIEGHLLSIFCREETDYGYKTKVDYAEIYMEDGFPSNIFDEYIIGRLEGKLEIEINVNEKNNQK